MLKNISRTQLFATWVAAVIVMMACSVVAGADTTIGIGQLWLAAGVVPPAVILLLWHGVPPVTVAELPYSVNRQSKEGRS
jgi:hypothetical protein